MAEYQSNAARVRRDPSRALPRQDTLTPVAMLNDAETLAKVRSEPLCFPAFAFEGVSDEVSGLETEKLRYCGDCTE